MKTGKRTARVRAHLTKRTVEALEPAEKFWIAWDDRLTGFGVRVQPSGIKSFIVNYRPGDGGRKAPNKRVVIGRHGRMAPDQARRKAQDMLGRVARGEEPAGERAQARGVPTLAEAFETYVRATIVREVDRDLRRLMDHPPATLSTVPTHLDEALARLETIAELLEMPRTASRSSATSLEDEVGNTADDATSARDCAPSSPVPHGHDVRGRERDNIYMLSLPDGVRRGWRPDRAILV